MRLYELIKLKRDGHSLDPAEIRKILREYASGEVPDYQMASLLMAVFFRGMSDAELEAWTRAMLESGQTLDLSDVAGVKVDKHSTGGVGDKVSLCLAPLVAACGVTVPMMSGRGLGHTGGTLDKLESIAGFRVELSADESRALLKQHRLAMMGQTKNLVPADKKLYALRDVTATVDCLPLIASSIMSKKLAEGMDALVMDVKVGQGAFLKSIQDARALGRTLMSLGQRMGKTVVCLLTDMDQPLGVTVGNALEMEEAIAVLRSQGPADVTELTYALGAQMLVLGKVASDEPSARARLKEAVDSGAALRKLVDITRAQGGDARMVEDPSRLPKASKHRELTSPEDGYVSALDAEGVGLAAVALGAGRETLESRIDPAVGFRLLKKRGDAVRRGEPLAVIELNDEAKGAVAERRLLECYRLGSLAPPQRPLVMEKLS